MKQIKCIQICSGISAPSEAVRNRNWKTVRYSEIDPYAIKYYEARNPNSGENLGNLSGCSKFRYIFIYDNQIAIVQAFEERTKREFFSG